MSVEFVRNSLITLFTVLYVYYTARAPYPRSPKIWVFEIFLFTVAWYTYFNLPKKLSPKMIDDLTDVNTNSDNVLSQTLAVIAAVGVLATFFIGKKRSVKQFTLVSEYLMISLVFSIIAIIPVDLSRPKNERYIYQINIRVLCTTFAFAFIGKAFITFIQAEKLL